MRRILTITEESTNKRLTTLEQLKTVIGDATTDNDVLYERAIDYCSNEISAYLNGDADETGDVTIGRETYSETIYGFCGTDLILSRAPVGDLVSVTEAGTNVARLIDDEANPAFSYIVKKSSGIVFKVPGFGKTEFSEGAITVAYTAGWILPGDEGRTLPFTIEDACILFCRRKIDEQAEGDDLAGPLTGVDVDGVGKFQFGQSASSKGWGLPYDVRNLLARYKTPTIA